MGNRKGTKHKLSFVTMVTKHTLSLVTMVIKHKISLVTMVTKHILTMPSHTPVCDNLSSVKTALWEQDYM